MSCSNGYLPLQDPTLPPPPPFNVDVDVKREEYKWWPLLTLSRKAPPDFCKKKRHKTEVACNQL